MSSQVSNQDAAKALYAFIDVVKTAVREAGDMGVSSGLIFFATSQFGMGFHTYTKLMRGLTDLQIIQIDGNHLVTRGVKFDATADELLG